MFLITARTFHWEVAGQQFIFLVKKLAGGAEVLPVRFWQASENRGNKIKKVWCSRLFGFACVVGAGNWVRLFGLETSNLRSYASLQFLHGQYLGSRMGLFLRFELCLLLEGNCRNLGNRFGFVFPIVD